MQYIDNFGKKRKKEKGDIYISERETIVTDHIMRGPNASSAETMFSVSSKIMSFSSYTHFFAGIL